MVKALLGQRALLARDGAVMHEDVGAGATHVLGDGLGGRPRLAEEQALLSLGDTHGGIRQGNEVRAMDDQQLSTPRHSRRIDDPRVTLRGPLQPREDLLRIADGRAQAHALHIVP